MLAIRYELVWISSLRIDDSIKSWLVPLLHMVPLLHKTLTMLSGSCKLVWIISPGITNHLSAANCRSCKESSLWTVSSGPTLFVRVSVPVYRVGRVNIGTHVWFVYLRPCTTAHIRRLCDCQRLGSACTPTNFPLYAWALSGLTKEHRLTKE